VAKFATPSLEALRSQRTAWERGSGAGVAHGAGIARPACGGLHQPAPRDWLAATLPWWRRRSIDAFPDDPPEALPLGMRFLRGLLVMDHRLATLVRRLPLQLRYVGTNPRAGPGCPQRTVWAAGARCLSQSGDGLSGRQRMDPLAPPPEGLPDSPPATLRPRSAPAGARCKAGANQV
jgi:hypothetical protein